MTPAINREAPPGRRSAGTLRAVILETAVVRRAPAALILGGAFRGDLPHSSREAAQNTNRGRSATARRTGDPSKMTTSPQADVRALLAPIAEDMAAVDRIIREELASDVRRMHEIGEYITSAGGKRMRPALLIMMARALGYQGDLAPYLGATIELLHTATLMHDDVVDESDMRRGRPTANARWGNGVAVLVGDFLYTRSFQMMIRAGNLKVMEALANAANRLSEGEVIQMANAHDPSVDEERYFQVIERKTACLFEAAARMAAAIADADEKSVNALAEYCLALGNAFQIADDILDYQGVAADIGKNLGGDLREGKMTLPLIYARELADEGDRAMIDEAVRKGDGDFDKISAVVLKSGALDRCRARAEKELERGRAALSQIPSSIFSESLLNLLSFTVKRDR